ncbi:SRPBCC family protein [Fodinicola feengrottensis]|uniref:SRPBCC family protein n=1 Tax=Fodinicola feengrottensis TaxID=435914 RepID=A0ABN2GET6_9ACTN|nr:SRPBCC family protein [Fodinicola feengrottensis]
MARAYFSTVMGKSADAVWSEIRSFDDYEWAGTVSETAMEDGRPGDAVGGVRRIVAADRQMRQRLLAHSDVDRSYTYEFCDPNPYPVRDYRATLRVTPVTDTGQAFVEWWATFDCAEHEIDKWTKHFEQTGFATWLGSLRTRLQA